MSNKTIPKKALKYNQGRISPTVTNIKDQDEIEGDNCIIDFKNYIKNRCGIDEINAIGHSKNALMLIKDMGLGKPQDIRPRDSVKSNGKYDWLYKGLAKDIVIKEIDFSKTGRIFYFVVRNRIYIRCIKGNHINLG